jgi:peptidoglycan/xylan/chitin deacetylase (PgdA/CDA1 family)
MPADHSPAILTYHSISNGSSPLLISPSLFLEQMEWLKRNAAVISLEDLVRWLNRGATLPARTVALTFDDGFEDFYSNAAPVLLRLDLPVTVFLPTAFCGKTNAWAGQPDWVKEQSLMDWQMIFELSKKGIRFGAHSVTHPILTAVPAAALEQEIVESKREIEVRTDRTPEFFCYPYGRWNSTVREMVSTHYLGACSTAAGFVTAESDPFALPRVDAHYVRNPAWFRRLFSPTFRAYLASRRLIRRLRGQPEGYLSAAKPAVNQRKGSE